MKSHIKRDLWRPTGYICRSVEYGPCKNWLGLSKRRTVKGFGPTAQAAYLDWYFRRYYSGRFDAGHIPEC